MRILFLTQIIPYPPDAGPRIKTWHVLSYLAEQGHEITLASFTRPEEERYLPALRQVCAHVHPVPIHRSRISDLGYGLRSLLTGRPFLVERDDRAAMRAVVRMVVECGKVDAIHADQLSMAQFALVPFSPPYRIFDAHNATWTIFNRVEKNVPWYLRPMLSFETRRIKRYEGELVETFDRTLAVTQIDRQAFMDAALEWEKQHSAGKRTSKHGSLQQRMQVIPITIDTTSLTPISRMSGSRNLLTLGTLHYPPNADGIRWFIRDVFPLVQEQVPDVTLTIVGKNPPADFSASADRSGGSIRVTGYVPDLTPYLERAALMVIPVRTGGGMRVRILEAFARGIPVVTTTIGLEGIDAHPGQDVIVADTPKDFSTAVVELLKDQTTQSQLARNGRRLVEAVYDRQIALQKLDQIYGQVKKDGRVVESIPIY